MSATTNIISSKILLKYKKSRSEILRNYDMYLMLIPFIIWYIIFSYKPMLGLQIAFKDYSIYKGIEASPWIGLENFKFFINSPYLWRTVRNTLLINIYGLAFGFTIPILLAILLNEIRSKNLRKSIQTMTYLPHFVSVVVIAGIITNLLSPTTGLVNIIIEKLGGERVYFLVQPQYFRAIYTTMNIWQNAGYDSIIYMAALAGVDVGLYEAAKVDGANKLSQIIHITIPGILPTIAIMLILRLGGLLSLGYEQIILLYQPATYETSDVISTFVYRSGLVEGRYDVATAVGLFNSVCAIILVWLSNMLSKKVTETGLW